MSEFQLGDRVRLLSEAHDGNEELHQGFLGTIVEGRQLSSMYLVAWDIETEEAECNDYRAHDVGLPYEEYQNRLWNIDDDHLELVHSKFPAFRKQKSKEAIRAYRIAKKIYELDMKWRIKQDAKANCIPV